MANAQGELLIPKGAKVGVSPTQVVISVNEFKTLDGNIININTGYNKVADNVDPIATGLVYTKDSVATNFARKASPHFTGVPTAPTAATGTNTTQVATTAGVLTEISVRNDEWVDNLNALGVSIKLLPISASTFFGTSTALVDGNHYQVLFRVKKTTTITGVKFNQGTASGVYVADGYNGIGLYSTDGTTNTKITETVNDGNLWKGTVSTTNSKAFPSPVVLSPGLYYFTFVWNTSDASPATIPTVMTMGSIPSTQAGFFGGYKVGMQRTVQSSLPSTETISTATGSTVVWGLMPY